MVATNSDRAHVSHMSRAPRNVSMWPEREGHAWSSMLFFAILKLDQRW
jgi:hypothetical protein